MTPTPRDEREDQGIILSGRRLAKAAAPRSLLVIHDVDGR